jgi:hypothetical protein
MPKTTKKAKTPRVKSGGKTDRGSKDPVTGLTLDLQGIGAIQSDKIYDSSSEQIRRLQSLAGGIITDEVFLELEYSDNAIVLNTITRRGGAATGSGGAGDYYNRNIFFGRFLPANGNTKNFQVDSYYRGGFYPWDTWDETASSRIPTTYEHVTRIDAGNLVLSTNLFSSISGLRGEEQVLFSTDPVTDFDAGWTSSQSRNAIPGEVSTFFQTGWHNADIFFTSNLI